jgi:hypothetical protein
MTARISASLMMGTTIAMIVAGGSVGRSDEGMWLFNNPPRKELQAKYGFDPAKSWLEHLQRAAVRFSSGGSGSFVSSTGLVLTNHHVGADALQKLGSHEHDYMSTGFFAKTPEEEIKCVDLELDVLVSIEDVTDRINAAVPAGADPAKAHQARRAAMNSIEQESSDKTGLRSDVVTFYQGGLYQLYCYKKYTDVRLVFAPEASIAFFGGDPDNFEYPRYDLDICLFRVYENGKPVKNHDYLKWSLAGAGDGELVFVAGNPGKTDRQDTVAHLEFLRDRLFPSSMRKIYRREVVLRTYSERSAENARRAQDELFMYQNVRKARLGVLAALQDPAVMRQKRAAENALREAVANDAKLDPQCATAWDEVAASLRAFGPILKDYDALEQGAAFNTGLTGLFPIARGLVRMAEETARPNGERLREYRKSNLESVKQLLFSEAPLYEDFQTVKLADSLSWFLEIYGPDDELVQKVLAGKSPRQRAAELVHGTRLTDVAFRKQLAAGGVKAVEASHDPMIELARLVDGPSRRVRKIFDEQVDEPQHQAYAKIAKARFAVEGTTAYPDATFTLRLAYGVVKGYTELDQQIPPWTTIGGAYRHAADHRDREPFALPPRWIDRKSRLDLQTPFNFVCTADIVGGNSGSPVVNGKGEFVGIIFDGNLDSLAWDFVFTEQTGRALAVHSSAILEALRKVYDAQSLADELGR